MLNKREANSRDSRGALARREAKHYKRMAFHECENCGGRDVFKAHDPSWMGWETWCWTCGVKDGEQTITFGVNRKPARPLAPRLLKHRDTCEVQDCLTCQLLAAREERGEL